MKSSTLSGCLAGLLLLLSNHALSAQGCVAIRQMGSCNTNVLPGAGKWQISAGYRYFQSFRHFKGTEEQPERLELNTEVINNTHGLDLSAVYELNNRWNLAVSLPLVYNHRSSLYEHGRVERHASESWGLADARVGAAFWLFHPERHTAGNLSIGAGLKLPTGNYRATDEFYNVGPNGASEIRPVDQSIQPGDGGWGFTLETQGFAHIGHGFGVYGNAFYLVNPRETNGTRTYRETLSPLLANESIMSVPDQFQARLGLNWSTPLHGLALALGGRAEGIPVRDVLGGSDGFRRPGYILSVEPGISWAFQRTIISVAMPWALVRNRTQSVTDKATEEATGMPRHGDAAFADYVINIGATWRLGTGSGTTTPSPAWPEAQ